MSKSVDFDIFSKKYFFENSKMSELRKMGLIYSFGGWNER